MKLGKLVLVGGEMRDRREEAVADLPALLALDGTIGGAVSEYEDHRGPGVYVKVYCAEVLQVWPLDAPIPLGCAAASRKVTKRLGMRVPRNVEA